MFVTPAHAQEGGMVEEGAIVEDEAHATTEQHVSEEHGTGLFPPFDSSTFASQLLWLAITFGLFYLLLSRVIIPRLGGMIEGRQARIRGDLDQAAALRGEADAAVAAYEGELAAARAQANAIGQDARDRAKADLEAERRTVEASLDARLAESQTRIEGIKAAAMQNVGTIAEDAAEAIVRQLTGTDVDRAAVQTAVGAVRR